MTHFIHTTLWYAWGAFVCLMVWVVIEKIRSAWYRWRRKRLRLALLRTFTEGQQYHGPDDVTPAQEPS